MAEQPLRILQVNTFDIEGGAAKVAWNLFAAYRERGFSSWLAVGQKRSRDPDVLSIPNDELRGRWFHFWWEAHLRLQRLKGVERVAAPLSRMVGGLAQPSRRLDFHRGIEDFHFPGTSHLLELAPCRPNIVHAHNLHGGYFDLRVLPWLSQQVPLILTLHDAWLLSGHCAHSFDCERWKTGCGNCPDLTIYPAIQRDATAYNWQRKRKLYTNCGLALATPSRWLMQKVEQSILAPAAVEARVVPNGVDLSVFHPADRRAIRAELGIPWDTRVFLFIANAVRQNIWKDYQTLRDALILVAERLPRQDVLFLALGEEGPAERIGQAEIRFVPYQAEPKAVARYYQAADVYVHAARADTFPIVVLEALACGVPVLATAVGGIPEQVEDARTGFLVPRGDPEALATRMIQLLSDDALRQRMGRQAIEAARQRFDLRQQVDTYLEWYRELVERSVSALAIRRK